MVLRHWSFSSQHARVSSDRQGETNQREPGPVSDSGGGRSWGGGAVISLWAHIDASVVQLERVERKLLQWRQRVLGLFTSSGTGAARPGGLFARSGLHQKHWDLSHCVASGLFSSWTWLLLLQSDLWILFGLAVILSFRTRSHQLDSGYAPPLTCSRRPGELSQRSATSVRCF